MNSTTGNTQSDVSVKVSPATIGCFVLLVSFFLPWVNVLGVGVAGQDMGKLSPQLQWLWAIPALSAVAMVLGFTGRRHMELAQIAGGLPLIILAVSLYQNGRELFSAIGIGGYGSILSGIFLLCIAPRLGRKIESVSASATASKL